MRGDEKSQKKKKILKLTREEKKEITKVKLSLEIRRKQLDDPRYYFDKVRKKMAEKKERKKLPKRKFSSFLLVNTVEADFFVRFASHHCLKNVNRLFITE